MTTGGSMPGDEIVCFEENLRDARKNVRDIRFNLEDIHDTVNDAQDALQFAAQIAADADDFVGKIRSLKLTLKVLDKVGPLKTPAKLINKALDKLEDVAGKVRTKALEIQKKIDESKISEKLEQADQRLSDYEEDLFEIETDIQEYEDAAAETIETFDFLGRLGDPIEETIDETVAPINRLLEKLNDGTDGALATYDEILGEARAFQQKFTSSLFYPMEQVGRAFADIRASLAFLTDPLDAAYSALKPIEGLLDAVGVVYSITVGPVVDWVLDTLGITKIMNDVADDIAAQLPFDANVLDRLADGFDDALAELEGFVSDTADGWKADVEEYLGSFVDDILGALGLESDSALKMGTRGPDLLVGENGVDDVLNGRGGDDTVQGQGGDDIFFATPGDDITFGGTPSVDDSGAQDRMRMKGSLLDWEYVVPEQDGETIEFYNVGGRFGYETVTGVELFIFDEGRFTLTDLRENVISVPGGRYTGRSKDEFIYASDAADIYGKGGNDRLLGSNFDDKLFGGAGADVLVSNLGADTVDGGKGRDTWTYAKNDSSGNSTTEVDLEAGTTWDGHSRDVLISIENIEMQDSRDTEMMGSTKDNRIIGNGGRDWIEGRDGDDTLVGGDGRDILVGGAGRDSLSGGDDFDVLIAGGAPTKVNGNFKGEVFDGGEGTDVLFYGTDYRNYNIETERDRPISVQTDTGPVRINAETGKIERLNDAGRVLTKDKATNIEQFVGSDGDDTLSGAQADIGEQIVIDGGLGNDVLFSDGASSTRGGGGDDLIWATGGGSFEGGGGVDTLDTTMMESSWFLRLVGAIGSTIRSTDLTDTGAPQQSGNFEGIEVLILGSGNDEVQLLGSNDMTIYGGDGDDILVRDDATDGTGSAILYGQKGNDYLELIDPGEAYGGAGNDTLYASASFDDHVLDGGAGDDLIITRRLQGEIDGGAGYDLLSLDGLPSSTVSSEVNLATGDVVVQHNSFSFIQDQIRATVTGIEAVVGSETFADRIIGTEGNERFIGRGGNDSLTGNGGDDELFGGAGNDVISGGAGNDLLHGGAGSNTLNGGADTDTASYAYAAPGGRTGEVTADPHGNVVASLATGRAAAPGRSDVLIDIENLTGGAGNDSLTGDDAANVLTGGAGDDTLIGGAGRDVLILGDGNDVADGGTGNDLFVLAGGDATLSGGGGIDTLDLGGIDGTVDWDMKKGVLTITETILVPEWEGGGTEARTYRGVSMTPQDVMEANPLFANDAADLTRILPSEGDPERQTFEIANRTEIVTHTVRLDSIERVEGGTSDDEVTGTRRDDSFLGWQGSDRLFGAKGADRLEGGGADDRLSGEEGRDTVIGGAGDDTILGGKGNDILRGDAGQDIFVFGTEYGADTVRDFRLDAKSGPGDLLRVALFEGEAQTVRAFKAASRQEGDDMVYDAGNDGINVIRLENVDLSKFSAADIEFF